jgi:hypothetical protein
MLTFDGELAKRQIQIILNREGGALRAPGFRGPKHPSFAW